MYVFRYISPNSKRRIPKLLGLFHNDGTIIRIRYLLLFECIYCEYRISNAFQFFVIHRNYGTILITNIELTLSYFLCFSILDTPVHFFSMQGWRLLQLKFIL